MGEKAAASGELSSFLDTGVYRLAGDSGAVFMDPVCVLGESYTRHWLRPSSYYSRSFPSSDKAAAAGVGEGDERASGSSGASRKRKRKKKKKTGAPRAMSERERAAERRHQEARPFLLKADESFLRATELVSALPDIIQDGQMPEIEGESPEVDFIELGSLWQASQCELSLFLQGTQSGSGICCGSIMVALFNNFVCNETEDDLEAIFLGNKYIIPKRSCFYMRSILYHVTSNACFTLMNFMKQKSDLRQIHNLIPAHSDYGFNFIVVDPPWENASASQKSLYPTLPSRHFLYIPVRQLAHTQGALVALWVTNREKLRVFIEEELFPAWGVTSSTAFYWLKVKADGSMLCDLDLFHHRPYEGLLLGYVNGKEVDCGRDTTYRLPQNNHIIITMPSAYSRKPPLGKLLSDYIPGPKPARCIELFARELISGWTSWGNEPLHFQDSRYFIDKIT